ncbi:PspA/IM30 family protein [Mangrovibacillus cuniculi]|uniref:PspA/IM30 family protein n=1 Tax=Mangrovibacillus cuniculi TaxID=2593652 RepID=A0A7S8C977_9BACI|nr:PspA/IM30 family protein [Mangrovibacillus cuniculi]QPC45735.1 PspA/IM30 family protein [Mangrovibacillus cuniculi]
MSTFMQRLTNTVMADLHAVLDKKEEKNPIATLNHAFRQAEKETEKVGELVNRQYRLVDEWETKLDQSKKQLAKRENQLVLANHHQEKELITFAEKEVARFTTLIEDLSQTLQEAKTEVTRLEMKYTEMKNKLEDMRIRQLKVMQQENVVRATEKANHLVDASKYEGTLESKVSQVEKYMKRMEEKLTRQQRFDSIDQRFEELEKKNS